MSFGNRYRVDTVPLAWRPVFYLCGFGFGFLLYAYFLLQRLTVAVEVEGKENLTADSNYIFCQWHDSVPLAFQINVPRLRSYMRQRPHAWMQHPSWYMKPIHVLLGLIGVEKIVLGSTGHRGRQAADELVELLRRGYSTVVLPDGPGGPPRMLKRGVLHMALQSRVLIVPLRVTASRYVRSKSWDRKRHPLPFSRVKLHVAAPIRVTEGTFQEAELELIRALG